MRPANDNDPRRFRGNARALNWLAKRDPDAALAVWTYGRATDQTNVADEEMDEDAAEDLPPYGRGSDVDRIHDIRPTINEMIADLLRVRVVTFNGQLVHRVDGMQTRPAFQGYTTYVGGMKFNHHPNARRPSVGGMMVSYTDADGRVRIPKYDCTKPRRPANDNRANWCLQVGDKQGVSRPVILVEEPEHAEQNGVLEMVLAGFSLKQIGQEMGAALHYADKAGARAVLAAAAWARERFNPPADTNLHLAA